MPGSFFDTNVLVYIASSDTAKADRAEAAIAAGGDISVQVLNELANVARRKMRMSWAETNALLDTLRSLLIVHPLTLEVHELEAVDPLGRGRKVWHARSRFKTGVPSGPGPDGIAGGCPFLDSGGSTPRA